ncbi:hypothetical protein COS75_01550 [Candidatus Pacearchaeota archaeon CG06_land_8_20_14_3_00_35_12]|nr:MAG: hypothetical protein COS75_01550 [Candidatus Pacearchaeota archaeon CG06_land_8_20_14_3_00_35_12]
MAIYQCNRCNYKFESSAEKAPKVCPYCSEAGSVSKERSAEQLLESIDEAEESRENRFKKR